MVLAESINFQAERAKLNYQQKFYMKYLEDVQSGYIELLGKHMKLLDLCEEQVCLLKENEEKLKEMNENKGRVRESQNKTLTNSPLKDISDGTNQRETESPDVIEKTQFSNHLDKVLQTKNVKCKILNDTNLTQSRHIPLNVQKTDLKKINLNKSHSEIRVKGSQKSDKKVFIQTKLNYKSDEKNNLNAPVKTPFKTSPPANTSERRTDIFSFNSKNKNNPVNNNENLIKNELIHQNDYENNKSDSDVDSDVIESTQRPQKQKKFKSLRHKSTSGSSPTEFLSAKSRSSSPKDLLNDSPDFINQTTDEPPLNDYETPEDTYCSISEKLIKKNIENKVIVSDMILANPPSSLLITEPGSLPNDSDEVLTDSDFERDCQIILPKTKKSRLLDSFDRFPEKKKVIPKIAFKGPTVRNKAERKKLPGHDCPDCKKYYDMLGLTEEERAKRKNVCSRHRSRFNERPASPPGLWDYKFPDSNYSSQE